MSAQNPEKGFYVLFNGKIWEIERIGFLTVSLVRDKWRNQKERTRIARSQLKPSEGFNNQLAFDLTA